MQSAKYANCWTAENSAEIAPFLRAFSETHRPFDITDVQSQTCPCSSDIFNVDLAQSAAQLTCIVCGRTEIICPDDSSWAECVQVSGDIDDVACDGCLHCEFNVAIGTAGIRDIGTSQMFAWLHLGVRCCKCGLLSCVNDYCPEIACSFDPSWLCELASQHRPDLLWLPSQLARCIDGAWTNECYVRFVDSTNANQPDAEWQYRESIELVDPDRGALHLDVLKDSRVGGIEFYDRLFIRQLIR